MPEIGSGIHWTVCSGSAPPHHPRVLDGFADDEGVDGDGEVGCEEELPPQMLQRELDGAAFDTEEVDGEGEGEAEREPDGDDDGDAECELVLALGLALGLSAG